MASLICRTDPGCQLLTCLPDGQGQAMQRSTRISRVQRCSSSGCARPAPSPCPALDSYIASMCCEVRPKLMLGSLHLCMSPCVSVLCCRPNDHGAPAQHGCRVVCKAM